MAHASYGNNSGQAAENKSTGSEDRPGFDLGGAKDRSGQAAKDLPAAGPHSKPELMNEDATPGAGTLPDPEKDDAVDSTSG